MKQFDALRGKEEAEEETEDGTETEEDTGEWLNTEAETDTVAETDRVAETDEEVVGDYTTAVACAILFFSSVVFGVTVPNFGWIWCRSGGLCGSCSGSCRHSFSCSRLRHRPVAHYSKSGRGMAGQRRARPGRRRGGSKYLKRGPARSGRVPRKRGRGHGHGPQNRIRLAFVRGGAKSGDGKVCMRILLYFL